MSPVTSEAIKNALRQVVDPTTGRDVVSAGLISGVAVKEGKVGFIISIDPRQKQHMEKLRQACEAAVKRIPGVEAVTAVLTAEHYSPSPLPPSLEPSDDSVRLQAELRRTSEGEGRGGGPFTNAPPPTPSLTGRGNKKPAVWNAAPLEGVRKIIAIASGKGGVGKSTTAVNLALALKKAGKRAGLLDADIYGPSIPRMLALNGQPEIRDGKMLPLENHGIPCMSMGFITGDEAAVLRGPMISKTLQQLLRSTRWGAADAPLDLLIVDMPPGTGDIHLSMAQQVPLDGAVIVTTPQAVAVIDARKCLKMFQKVGVPVLGVIENMSGGLFGSGGGKKLAEEMDVPFLGAIPIDAAIVEASDEGKIYAGVQTAQYRAIARQLSG